MKFEEIIPSLRKGKRVRQKFWKEDEYIYLSSKGDILDQQGLTYFIYPCVIFSNDWEIVEERSEEDEV